MENQPPPEQPIRAEAQPLQPEAKTWMEHYAAEQRQTPARLEEVAKFLTGIISICITIFIDKRPPNLSWWAIDGLTLASLLWVVAGLLSFIVMFPRHYAYNDTSPESIQALHKRIVRWKFRLLVASGGVFLAGLLVALFIFKTAYQMAWPANGQ